MIRWLWALSPNLFAHERNPFEMATEAAATFRENWSRRQLERTDPRALAGDELIAAAKQAWR